MEFNPLPKTREEFHLHVDAYRAAVEGAGHACLRTPALISPLMSWVRYMKPFHITTNAHLPVLR